jgi:hypothetical protein
LIQGTAVSVTTDDVRDLIRATIPEGEPWHFKWKFLEDREALTIIAISINDGVISIDRARNITEYVARILRLDAMKAIFLEGVISLDEIFAVIEPPSEDFFRLFRFKDDSALLQLFSAHVVSFKQLCSLEVYTHSLLIETFIQQAMQRGELSLSRLQRLEYIGHRLLNSKGVRELIEDRCMTVGCFFNVIERHGKNAYILTNKKIQKRIRNKTMDVEGLSEVALGLLAINDEQVEAGSISIPALQDFARCLSSVVNNAAMNYLYDLASPQTIMGFHCFTQLIARVKKEGVEAIWERIEDHVANELFHDFVRWRSNELIPCDNNLWNDLGALSLDQELIFTEFEYYCQQTPETPNSVDNLFQALWGEAFAIFREQIQVGRQVILGDLSIFQQQVQHSKGHDAYFLRCISRPPEAVFFRMEDEGMHDDPMPQ